MNASSEQLPADPRPKTRGWWIASAGVVGFGLWWLGSILLHVLLFGVLYAAGPKQPAADAAAADDFHMTISPEHVESVVAEIRDQQKEEFAKKVEELASIKAQLDALNAKKVEQYNALMQDVAKQAPQTAGQAAEEVKASQAEALKAQQNANDAVAKMNAARAKAASEAEADKRAQAQQDITSATQAAKDAQETASQAQKKAAAAQVKMQQQVELFGDATVDAKQASQAAMSAQSEAERQQETAVATRAGIEQQERRLNQLATEAQRTQTTADAAKQKVEGMEKRLAELQPPPPPAATPASTEPAAPTATTAVGNDAATAPSPALVQATPAPPATPAPTPTKQAKAEIDRLSKTLPQARDAEAKAASKAKDAQDKQAAAQAEAGRTTQQLRSEQEEARRKQQAAMDEQEKANQQVAANLSKPGLSPSSATASTAPPPVAPTDANLADLYRQAQQMETAVSDSYRNVRAAELAAIRKIPLSQAMAVTEVAKPVRAEIDTAAMTRDIRDVQGVREQEKTIEEASGQMNSMVALAERMKDLALPAQPATVSVDALKSSAAQAEHMEQLAMEDEGAQAKDLTAAMTGGATGSGHRHHRHSAAADAALAAANAALVEAGAKLAANPLDPKAALEYQQALANANALAAAAAAGSAEGDDSDMEGSPGPAAVADLPYLNAQHFKPIPGRTITHDMVAHPADRENAWMFVDSWYLIGPWPNPARKNLDTKFPPETVVDLDASYTGGRRNEAALPIHWHFYQASAVKNLGAVNDNSAMIVPPGLDEFEIYYGYTELWLDDAADLWVAIGSDDQSKVWLNDQMIWKSADYYKPWVANEGLRKVHFNKGINRLLYRLENGHSSGGYSFMVCLDPHAPPPPEAKPAGRR